MHPLTLRIRTLVRALVGRSAQRLPAPRADYAHGLLAELDVIATSRATLSWCAGALLFIWRQRMATTLKATPQWESPGHTHMFRLYPRILLSLLPAAASGAWLNSLWPDYYFGGFTPHPTSSALFFSALALVFVLSWAGPVIVLGAMRRLAVRRALVTAACAAAAFLVAVVTAVQSKQGASAQELVLGFGDALGLEKLVMVWLPLFLPLVVLVALLPGSAASTVLRLVLIPLAGFAFWLPVTVLQTVVHPVEAWNWSYFGNGLFIAGGLLPVMLVPAPRWPSRTSTLSGDALSPSPDAL